MTLEIAEKAARCRDYIEMGEREAAYGELAEILEHFRAAQQHLPLEVEFLYGVLLLSDANREFAAEVVA